jgi:hypothetical protein
VVKRLKKMIVEDEVSLVAHCIGIEMRLVCNDTVGRGL